MSTARELLLREVNKKETFSNEANEKELVKIFIEREKLFTMIEEMEDYQAIKDTNSNFKTAGNIYSYKQITFFSGVVREQAIVYEKSKGEYITNNLKLILKQIDFSDDYMMDDFQNGALYLQRSFNMFNDKGAVKFITYAYSYIKFGILNGAKKKNIISQNDNLRFLINRIKDVKKAHNYDNLSANYISTILTDYSVAAIERAMNITHPVMSLNKLVDNEGDGGGYKEFQDYIADDNIPSNEEQLDKENFLKSIRKILTEDKFFSERDRKILTMRFSIGLADEYTLQEVGTQFGITRERVRQLESKALAFLKRKHSRELMEHY